MKLLKLYINDKSRNLIINEISFNDLTLLVGMSGVGKTQIINSIINLKRISNGYSVNGFNWKINFETIQGSQYIWEGGFETNKNFQEEFMDENSDEYKKNKSKILYEKLSCDSKEIVNRDGSKIIFNNSQTVKLSQQESIVSLLKEEDSIAEVYNAFKKIIYSDQSTSITNPFILSFFDALSLEKKHISIESIQDLDEDIRLKLYLSYKNAPDVFKKIKERYIEVFPQVEDVIVAPIKNKLSNIFDTIKEHPFIQIKETGVKDWIHQGRISSGMFRTLLHIAEMYLSAKGTVILIDEFENSLGINCIDELTNDLVNGTEHKIQFIITSHHPYIINNIAPSHWKVITRQAGNINAFDAKDLNIGKSKHDAFMQLINIDEYISGINA